MVELLDIAIEFKNFCLSESIRVNDADSVIVHADDQRLAILGEADVPDVFDVHDKQKFEFGVNAHEELDELSV